MHLRFFIFTKMVGIWAKIKNGFNWIKDHIFKPVVNTVKKIIHNPFVKTIVDVGAPLLNTVVPGLGTGISTGFNIAGGVADAASNLMSDHDKGGTEGVIQKAVSGGYNQTLSQIPAFRRVMNSMKLAKRPEELNPLIELKRESGDIAK